MQINISRINDKELKRLYSESRKELMKRKANKERIDFIASRGLERFVSRFENVFKVREFTVGGYDYRLGWVEGMSCDVVRRPEFKGGDFELVRPKDCPVSINRSAAAFDRKIKSLCGSFHKWARQNDYSVQEEVDLFEKLGCFFGSEDVISKLYSQDVPM